MRMLAASLALIAAPAVVAQGVAPSVAAAAEPAPAPFDAAVAHKVVAELANLLEANFVFPDVGAAYARSLRAKLAAGGYDRFADAPAFAAAVTADIHAIQPDGHLRLQPPLIAATQQGQRRAGPDPATAIPKAGWIAPGIAYISFESFPGNPATLAKLRTFLADHASARTLIIDARVHRGGGLGEMDVIFPYLFGEATALVQMDTRLAVEEAGRGVFEDGPTVRRIAGPPGVVRREHVVLPGQEATGLRTATVYLLTSGRTASAAEHLSFALKRTGRATLIGENTAGAGHFGQPAIFESGYRAFIPVGRTFDPQTGAGWEGTGVKPDVEVPAERALHEALVRSGIAPEEAERLSSEYRPQGSMERRMPLRG